MGGAPLWVWRDGQRLTPAMLVDFLALDEEFYQRTGCRLKISSGIRTDEEQERIWYERYVPVWDVRGRKVYDFRWWRGIQWARISPDGTVAPPGSSNHQINLAAGRRGALDLYDTGSDPGILTRGTFRARVFDEIAPKHGYDSEGYAFGENWHKRYNRDPWRAVPAGGGAKPLPVPPPPLPEVLDMATQVIVTVKDNNNRALTDDKRRAAFVDPASGFCCEFSYLTVGDANGWAKQVGMEHGALGFSDAGFDEFVASLAEVRAGKK